MRNLLLGSVASIAILTAMPDRGWADCLETTLGVYDCSSGQSVKVNVPSGVGMYGNLSVTGPGDSRLGNAGRLDNSVVATGNDSFVLANSGAIQGTVTATDNLSFTLNNSGSIAGNINFVGSGRNIVRSLNSGTVSNGVSSSGDSEDIVLIRGSFSGAIRLTMAMTGPS